MTKREFLLRVSRRSHKKLFVFSAMRPERQIISRCGPEAIIFVHTNNFVDDEDGEK